GLIALLGQKLVVSRAKAADVEGELSPCLLLEFRPDIVAQTIGGDTAPGRDCQGRSLEDRRRRLRPCLAGCSDQACTRHLQNRTARDRWKCRCHDFNSLSLCCRRAGTR